MNYLKIIFTLLLVGAPFFLFSEKEKFTIENNNIDTPTINETQKRIEELNHTSPFNFVLNEEINKFIQRYLKKDTKLIPLMIGRSKHYFPIFESYLDRFELPMELKYLAVIESSLNPKARSSSGATGLWQFMYSTGKEYGLSVNSYFDQRQDPFKSTEAACKYFVKLYDMFGDWNLVLAAYNGGPGYIRRKIQQTGLNNYWDLQPHLRKETREYVPKFIAVSYLMTYYTKYNIVEEPQQITFNEIDTLKIKQQIELKTLSELTCVNKETINFLNPTYKKNIFPIGSILFLPHDAVVDFKNNEEANYIFINKVKNKEILIDEKRDVYCVVKGDYLGKIAKKYNVSVFNIKEWNNLKNTKLDIGQKLIIFYKEPFIDKTPIKTSNENKYVVKKGDTLWGIAKKFNNLSVWKIKEINHLDNNDIKPGTVLILPTT